MSTRKRKTIRVEHLREKVNTYLANSPKGNDPKDVLYYQTMRQGASGVLETILHETGNYKGFSYLDLVGVEPHRQSEFMLTAAFDQTRRHYI